jgi:hypothetical protein
VFIFHCRSDNGSKKQKKEQYKCADPPLPDDETNEDSNLMSLFYSKSTAKNGKQYLDATSTLSLFASLSSSMQNDPTSPDRRGSNLAHTSSPSSNRCVEDGDQLGPLRGNSDFNTACSSPSGNKKRQPLTPAPLVASPSWGGSGNRKRSMSKTDKTNTPGKNHRLRINLEAEFDAEAEKEEWCDKLCVDWSIKTRLAIVSDSPYSWNSATLKCSEESSGTSAFVRCIDMDPENRKNTGFFQQGSQLDTSSGAQFHQCCLYWQHPTLPSVDLFPRDSASTAISFNFSSAVLNSHTLNGIRLEDKVLDVMLTEWYFPIFPRSVLFIILSKA